MILLRSVQNNNICAAEFDVEKGYHLSKCQQQ